MYGALHRDRYPGAVVHDTCAVCYAILSAIKEIEMKDNNLSRRNIITAGAIAGAGLGLARAEDDKPHRSATIAQTEGPFYPVTDQSDKDADLTQIDGVDGVAVGEVVVIEGRIVDESSQPIADAVVDVWRANAAGRYAHESDPNPAPLDRNFQGWAIMKTDAEGRYRFKTVKPGAYPVEEGWDRPPHIHFKVSRRGWRDITTQMYFPDEPLNDVDKLLLNVPQAHRAALIAQQKNTDGVLNFDVVLEKV